MSIGELFQVRKLFCRLNIAPLVHAVKLFSLTIQRLKAQILMLGIPQFGPSTMRILEYITLWATFMFDVTPTNHCSSSVRKIFVTFVEYIDADTLCLSTPFG